MGQGRRGTSLEEARARAHGVHPRSLPRSHRGGCVCSCRKGKGSIRKGSIPDLPERPAEARPALCPPRDLDDMDDLDDLDDLDLDLDLDRAESQPISTGGTTLSTRPSGARLGRAGGEGGATRGWATVPLALARGVRPRPPPSRSHQPRSDPKPWRQHAEPTSGRAGGIPPLLVPLLGTCWRVAPVLGAGDELSPLRSPLRSCRSPSPAEGGKASGACSREARLGASRICIPGGRRASVGLGGGSVGRRWGLGGRVHTRTHVSHAAASFVRGRL